MRKSSDQEVPHFLSVVHSMIVSKLVQSIVRHVDMLKCFIIGHENINRRFTIYLYYDHCECIFSLGSTIYVTSEEKKRLSAEGAVYLFYDPIRAKIEEQ